VYIALVVLHVFLSMGIIAIVLLQAGKGADIGSAFGGAGSQAVFGSMGTPTLLGKITTGIAIFFTITSFTLAILGAIAQSALTARQRRVLRGVFEGLTNKQIAAAVGVTEPAIKATLQQLFRKTRVRTRAQLVRVAVQGVLGNADGRARR